VVNIGRYPTYKGGKVTEVVVYASYIGLHQFYRYVVNIGRWSPYEGGQLDRFHCICKYPAYWRPFLHLQPEDVPCHGDRDPPIVENRKTN